MSALAELAVVATEIAYALPDPDPVAPPGFEGVTTILGWAKWAGLIVAILALIALGATFAINNRRGEGAEHLKWLVGILVGVLIIGAATAIVGFLSGA
jgi:hypothetical protein